MSTFVPSNQAHFLFRSDGRPQGDLEVLEFSGSEHLSAPFQFQISVVCKDVDVDLEAIIDAEACLTLRDGVGDRYVHGVVSSAQLAGRRVGYVVYQLTLVPTLWKLGLIRQSRIFQKETTPDILQAVLAGSGVVSDRVRIEVTGDYQPRDYCVQYRESDLAFIQRLMEEEGLFYFFEHSESAHTLIISDDKVVHSPLALAPALRFREGGGMNPGERSVHGFNVAHTINTGKVTQRDYSYKKPTLNLDTEAESDRFGELVHIEYPGEYVDSGLGNTLTKLKKELFESMRRLGRGRSDSPQLCPGFLLNLLYHFRFDLNRCYLLASVQHRGQQPQVLGEAGGGAKNAGYSNSFQVLPDDVQYRPPRRTPRPLITGLQTATVVGPDGQEIYTDDDARIKVRFHWDKGDSPSDQASCWIRVAQAWAGNNFGAVFVPRIGHEVVVQFLEGDPDRPLVTGCVYNGDNRPPYGPPDSNTISTMKSESTPGGGGFNELRFEDKAGQEEIWMHGQKDMNTTILNDRTEGIGHDDSLNIGNDKTIVVGHDRSKEVKNDQSEIVGNNKAIAVTVNHDESIGGDKSLSVGGVHNETIGSDMSISIAANLTESVGENYSESVAEAMSLTVGKGMTAAVSEGLSASVGDGATVSIGANLSQSVGEDVSVSIGGKSSTSISKDASWTVNGATTIGVSKTLAINVDDNISMNGQKKITLDASDELLLQCGDASILLKKSGDIVVDGKKISIKGSGNIVMKGSKILQN